MIFLKVSDPGWGGGDVHLPRCLAHVSVGIYIFSPFYSDFKIKSSEIRYEIKVLLFYLNWISNTPKDEKF